MPKLYALIFLCFCVTASAQIINIPDPNFKATLLAASPDTNFTATLIAFDSAMSPIAIDANQDGEIQISEALTVYKLDMIYRGISSLSGIENFTNLAYLDAGVNEITSFDATSLPNLKTLNLNNNALTSINVAGMAQLEGLMVDNNQLSSVDLTGLTNLKGLGVYGNPISNVSVTHLANLEFIEGGGDSSLISSVDVSGLQNLNTFYWFGAALQSVDITGCVALEVIDIETTMLSELDVAHCPLLYILRVGFNQLTELDVSQNPLLQDLDCKSNFLTTLTVNSNDPYFNLNCMNNGLTELNITGPFEQIFCLNNELTTLDLSGATFSLLNARDNNLFELLIKNGQNNTSQTTINNNPIAFICADESEILYFQNPGNTGLGVYHVNPYCSFEPGGPVYTIQGNAAYDLDSDGCDAEDLQYLNIKFNISDGTQSGAVISETPENYSMPLNSGAYTITPQLEYPGYFTISPSTVAISFPEDGSNITQNFCVTANGNHNDLEVLIVPVSRARPGFNAQYQITFKNNGTSALSGNVTMAFDDIILDFVSSEPAASVAGDMLSWDYNNLMPFESRSVALTLNLNSPMETPAVNNGDLLTFTAVVYPVEDDDTPADNTFVLRQIVVGSSDPNDKVCLEGDTVSPEMIGDYVHYMIRFENVGTYAAENIVVKDNIDQSKFDMATLMPVAGSHPFRTNISDGNKVEFIFENINLPFDDGSNDGYITFKIKTLPSLQVGDTFTNNASIYFDYNFPVVTNTAATSIQLLGTPEVDFSKHFAIYPNPAGSILNIRTSTGIQIKAVQILNMLGQQVLKMAGDVDTVDVSMLHSGIYIINIESEQGSAAARFIKN